MPSRILLAIFLLAGSFFLYLVFEKDDDRHFYYLSVCAAMCVAIYLFSPQINWWWWKRRPPELPPMLRQIINTQLPFYQRLTVEEKAKFRTRVVLFMEAQDFKLQGGEHVPADVKGAVAIAAVQLTFGLEKFLFKKFETVVIYKHPFPSMQFERWHTSEIYEEDGVLLFSAEQLMASFFSPQRYFQIALYEYARVFMRSYPKFGYPKFGEEAWGKLERISGFSKEAIGNWIGLPDNIETAGVAIAHFFVFPQNFKREMPDEYEALAGVFKQRPA